MAGWLLCGSGCVAGWLAWCVAAYVAGCSWVLLACGCDDADSSDG